MAHTLYRYTDATGEHLVESLSEVPAAAVPQVRAVAGRVQGAASDSSSLRELFTPSSDGIIEGWMGRVHVPSATLGFGAALGLVLLARALLKRTRRLLTLALALLLLGGLLLGYSSYTHRVAVSELGLKVPTERVDEVRRAVGGH
jgi:hypothetical protein